MSQGNDKMIGAAMLGFGGFVFSYYTIWTLIMPFVDEEHPAQALFPDRWYAIAIPVFLLVVGVTGIGGFIAMVMIKSGQTGGKKSS